MEVKKTKPKHLYRIITKIGNNEDGSAKCIKHRTSDLLKYTDFIDKEFSTWTWFNVFSNKGINEGEKLASFSKFNRPHTRKI